MKSTALWAAAALTLTVTPVTAQHHQHQAQPAQTQTAHAMEGCPGMIAGPMPAQVLQHRAHLALTDTQVARLEDLSRAAAAALPKMHESMQARGEITITATLTTWGDYSKRGAGPPTHPDLPVWVVKVERPPWSEWRGPVGKQIRVTWYGWSYVIDGLTGNMINGSRISEGGR